MFTASVSGGFRLTFFGDGWYTAETLNDVDISLLLKRKDFGYG